ncbi:MAG TPA: squalene/phytoene synthase family protein [Caulobacteraceae bacterium]
MADGEIEDVVRRTDPGRWLASRLVSNPQDRADLLTLYAFDAELDRAIQVTSSPLTAELRLTWWFEALEEIAGEGSVRAHPLAQQLCELVRRRRLPIDLLQDLIEGRIATLGMAQLDEERALAWADAVGGSGAVLAALTLGAGEAAPNARAAGRLMGVGALLRRGVIGPPTLASSIGRISKDAKTSARRLPVQAFPSVAAAALVKDQIRGRRPSELAQRVRLLWASVRGAV